MMPNLHCALLATAGLVCLLHAIAARGALPLPQYSPDKTLGIQEFLRIGSGVVINTYHPGRENFTHPGAWKLAAWNLSGFAESNLWNEFKPDIKYLIRSKLFHRK